MTVHRRFEAAWPASSVRPPVHLDCLCRPRPRGRAATEGACFNFPIAPETPTKVSPLGSARRASPSSRRVTARTGMEKVQQDAKWNASSREGASRLAN
jgi:hypothetical protein